jgi:hypothetical protein
MILHTFIIFKPCVNFNVISYSFLYSLEQWTLHSRIWFVNKKQNGYCCNFQWIMTGCYSLVVIFHISTGYLWITQKNYFLNFQRTMTVCYSLFVIWVQNVNEFCILIYFTLYLFSIYLSILSLLLLLFRICRALY